MSTSKKIALVVHTCDAYEFLYKGFAYFFAKHWDFSIPCTLYFATEEKDVTIPGFQTVHSGKGEWADRLARLLRGPIREKYILYFQEDMWFNKDVNGAFFKGLFELAQAQGWKQVKLHSGTPYFTRPTPFTIEGFTVAKLDNETSGYLMSHQVTLWERHFLLDQLHRNEHPYRNERRGTKRLRKLNPDIYQIDYFSDNGTLENNQNPAPHTRSEYQSISLRGTLNDNIQPFIDELMQGNVEERGYALRLQYHYDNKITHGGKPFKPKRDLYREVKHWIRAKLRKRR
ncbi:MAG TPA: hypothetical protein VGE66_11040 [Chitinophagaceae bacterium]